MRKGSLVCHTPAADEDLRLQQPFPFARFALYMEDRVPMLYIRIEAKNHAIASVIAANCAVSSTRLKTAPVRLTLTSSEL